jgi:hypothetical protein
MLTKAQELSGLASWIYATRDKTLPVGDLPKAIANQLETARLTAAGKDTRETRGGNRKRLRWRTKLMSASGGASFERTLGNLDAAEVNLLRLAPTEYLAGQLPNLQSHVNRYLPKDDPRRIGVDTIARREGHQPCAYGRREGQELSGSDRGTLVAAYHAANSQRRRDLIRVRNFRNLLIAGSITLFGLAIAVAIIGQLNYRLLPLCYLPEDKQKFVCPQAETSVPELSMANIDQLVRTTAHPDDLLLIEIVGLVAATVAGAVALRNMRGTSTPFGVPLALITSQTPVGGAHGGSGSPLHTGRVCSWSHSTR